MKNKIIKQLVVDAMFIALLVVSSFISIPISQIPYTMQTLVVFIILLLLPIKDVLIIFILYLIMGLIGLPVFSGFTSGVTPTLGFIIGFVISPFIFLIFSKIIKTKNTNINAFIKLLICLMIINISGCLFYMLIMKLDLLSSFIITILPYILFDILKIIVAIIISNRIKFLFQN